MSIFSNRSKGRLFQSTAIVMALSLSPMVAEATCSPNRGTPSDDTITCDGRELFSVSTGTGDDVVTVTSGSGIRGRVVLGSGDDTITLDNAGVGWDSATGARYNLGISGGAGNDTISVTNGSYVGSYIRGEDGDDVIRIEGPRTISVNVSTPYSVQADVNGGDGDDRIIIDGASIGSFVEGGNGADTITLRNANIRTVFSSGTDSASDGDDVVTITGSTIGSLVRTGGGADTLTITDTTMRGYVSSGSSSAAVDGDDRVTLTNVTGVTHVTTGAGADTLVMTNTDATSVTSGSDNADDGDDIVTISDSTLSSFVRTGGGADTLSISNSTMNGIITTGNNTATVDGGDTVTLLNVMGISQITTGAGGDSVTMTNTDTRTDVVLGSSLAADGDDTLVATDSDIGRSIITGAGADSITLTNSTVGISINTGSNSAIDGNDVVNLTGSSVLRDITTGAGADTVNLTNSSVARNITTGSNSNLDGDDQVNLNNSTSGIITTGDGLDTVIITNGSTTSDVRTGDGDDTVTITGSTVGDSTVNEGVDLGDGDDVITLDGTIKGFVDLGAGMDSITLDSNTVIDTTSRFTVYGRDGVDTITINGGTYTGISAGNDDDIVTLNGGTINEILADGGNDTVNLYGGTILRSNGLRLGAGDDTLVVDPTMSSDALDLTAVDIFNGDGGTDTATFSNVQTGTHLMDDAQFIRWDSVTFDNSVINISHVPGSASPVTASELNLINGTTLNQIDGHLVATGASGYINVDGTSVINMQDGDVEDRISGQLAAQSGSILAVDINVADAGYRSNQSDYISGGVHTPTAGALVNVALLGGEAALSGSRRIVDSSASNVGDPGAGATPMPSAFYGLDNDPSTASRVFWLQDDAQGGVFLAWTTPVSGTTAGGAIGGAVTGGTLLPDGTIDPNDPNVTVDPSGKGAGTSNIVGAGGLGGAAASISSMAASSARGVRGGGNAGSGNGLSNGGMSGKKGNGSGSGGDANSSDSYGGSKSCQGGKNGLTYWGSGSYSGSEYGATKVDGGTGAMGVAYDLADAMNAKCGMYSVGAFVFAGESEVDDTVTNNGSQVSSFGYGAYISGATESQFYGSLVGFLGQDDTDSYNAVLDSFANYDADNWGVQATLGKIFPMSSSLSANLAAFAGYVDSDNDGYVDSKNFAVTSIQGETTILGLTGGLHKNVSTNMAVHGDVGVKNISIDSTLLAYDIPVESKPEYTVGTAEVGFTSTTANKMGSLQITGFGEFGSDIETFGAQARFAVKF